MADELFNTQAPVPTGIMPGSPEFDEEAPTGQEQADYDQFVNKALDFMSKRAEPMVASMNNKDKPVYENVGELTVKIGQMVMGSASAGGVEIGPDILHAAGQEIVEHLMELGDAAGIFPFEKKSEEYEQTQAMAFLHAANVAGNELIQSPQYNEEMKDEAGTFYAQQVAGETARGETPEGFHETMGNDVAAAMRRAIQGG